MTENAPPDEALLKDGGFSGQLLVEPGDRLEWTCDVNNTTNDVLRFANEAYTAEMCLLMGEYISESFGLFTGACTNGSCVSIGGGTGTGN